jgi:hypothetical protein
LVSSRVRERKFGPLTDAGLLELADRRLDHRVQVREIGGDVRDSAAITTWLSSTTACAL